MYTRVDHIGTVYRMDCTITLATCEHNILHKTSDYIAE